MVGVLQTTPLEQAQGYSGGGGIGDHQAQGYAGGGGIGGYSIRASTGVLWWWGYCRLLH